MDNIFKYLIKQENLKKGQILNRKKHYLLDLDTIEPNTLIFHII